MSYAHEYPEGHEHEYSLTVTEEDDGYGGEVTTYLVSAVGGGTVGKGYSSQAWHWAVAVDGRAVAHGSDLFTGPLATTHAEAARVLRSFRPDAEDTANAHDADRGF